MQNKAIYTEEDVMAYYDLSDEDWDSLTDKLKEILSDACCAVNTLDEARAALGQAAAGFAVIANQEHAIHPGCADQENLNSVRGFARENFHAIKVVLAKLKGGAG